MKKDKRINFYNIFVDVMKCFISSCGIVLLIAFFEGVDFETITKNNIRNAVLGIFVILSMITILYKFLSSVSNWFYDEELYTNDMPSIGVGKNILAQNKEVADYNRKVSAIHEAGHALMAYLQQIDNYDVVMSHTNSRVVTTVYKLADSETVKKWILIKYAGATAEELLLNKLHFGSMGDYNGDFESATRLIKSYIVMSDNSISKSLLDDEMTPQIIALSKEFYQDTKDMLKNHITMLNSLAARLIEKDTLSQEEIGKIIQECCP